MPEKKDFAIHNPHNKPMEDLPFIYGFNNGGQRHFLHAQLIAEDGTPLGSHMCSSEGFMYGDLGILKKTRSDRHEDFKKHYPDGYQMDFITLDQTGSHEGLNKAFELNKQLTEDAKTEGSDAEVSATVSGGNPDNPGGPIDPDDLM